MIASMLVSLIGAVLSMEGATGATPQLLPATVPPALGCYFVHDEDLQPANRRAYLEQAAWQAGFTYLTTSLRLSKGELTDESIHEVIRDITNYAATLGVGILMDLDVRLAREAFRRAYPAELQEMLRYREVSRVTQGETVLEIEAETLSDHYTGRTTPYLPVASRLVRVYAFARGPEGIEPDTVEDITSACRLVDQTEKKVRVSVPASASTTRPVICAGVAFAHLTPDVYAEHLLSFQRDLMRKYADLKLAGACKDEWGFPPCFDGTPDHNDFWYSEAMAASYRQATGRDLVRDMLLMYTPERGRAAERQGAINQYMEMNRHRNIEIEGDFYAVVKEVFGTNAMVSTHPTWYPHPDRREFKKNGLDWWGARRDYAQTDEVAPFCARTALAKKWNNSVWYNMFYASEKKDYETSLWAHALAGGRINYHPLYPLKTTLGWSMTDLYAGGLMRGEARIRLLNFMLPAPLDCPIAVVFGHACAMNWAGPAYDDVGLDLANAFWHAGYYADLIPSSEIEAGALRVDGSAVMYGTQRYRAVVLYHPEFEKPSTAAFFKQAAEGSTRLFRIGEWTRAFDGAPLNGNDALPSTMTVCPEIDACVKTVIAAIKSEMAAETPAIDRVVWGSKFVTLPPTGQCRLVDGTQLILAGQNDPAGDPIRTAVKVKGHRVQFDAVGVAAVRLAEDGTVDAMAAGNLKQFKAGSLEFKLATPVDIALWRDHAGQYHGAVYSDLPLEDALTALTKDWIRLTLPMLPGKQK